MITYNDTPYYEPDARLSDFIVKRVSEIENESQTEEEKVLINQLLKYNNQLRRSYIQYDLYEPYSVDNNSQKEAFYTNYNGLLDTMQQRLSESSLLVLIKLLTVMTEVEEWFIAKELSHIYDNNIFLKSHRLADNPIIILNRGIANDNYQNFIEFVYEKSNQKQKYSFAEWYKIIENPHYYALDEKILKMLISED